MILLKHQIVCSQWSKIIGFYDENYVYVMVNSKLPLYVASQCSGHSVEYFLRNIDIYDCFLAIILKFTERLYGMIVIAGMNG